MSFRIVLLVEVDPSEVSEEDRANDEGPFYDYAEVTPTHPGEFCRYDFDSDQANTGSVPYSHNLYFRQVIPGGIRSLDEKPAAEVAELLDKGSTSLRHESLLPKWLPFRAFFAALEETSEQNRAAHILSRLASWAKENPQGTFEVY